MKSHLHRHTNLRHKDIIYWEFKMLIDFSMLFGLQNVSDIECIPCHRYDSLMWNIIHSNRYNIRFIDWPEILLFCSQEDVLTRLAHFVGKFSETNGDWKLTWESTLEKDLTLALFVGKASIRKVARGVGRILQKGGLMRGANCWRHYGWGFLGRRGVWGLLGAARGL